MFIKLKDFMEKQNPYSPAVLEHAENVAYFGELLKSFKESKPTRSNIVMFKLSIRMGFSTTILTVYGFQHGEHVFCERGIYKVASVEPKPTKRSIDVPRFYDMVVSALDVKYNSEKKSSDNSVRQSKFWDMIENKLTKMYAKEVEVGDTLRVFIPNSTTEEIGHADFKVVASDGNYVDGEYISHSGNVSTQWDMDDVQAGELFKEIIRGYGYAEKI